MKFPLQYAKLLSQKYLNIDDDIIPEIEMCLEKEGDKVSIPYDVEEFGTIIKDNGNNNDGNHIRCDSWGNGDGYGNGDSYGYDNGNGNGEGEGNGNGNSDNYSYNNGYNYDYRNNAAY